MKGLWFSLVCLISMIMVVGTQASLGATAGDVDSCGNNEAYFSGEGWRLGCDHQCDETTACSVYQATVTTGTGMITAKFCGCPGAVDPEPQACCDVILESVGETWVPAVYGECSPPGTQEPDCPIGTLCKLVTPAPFVRKGMCTLSVGG